MKSPMAVRIETTWSEAEKKIARQAFDRAFERQCDTITEKAKRMLATSSPPHGIWQVHDYLSRERKKVDRTYDYRYSVLISVFADLLRQGWLKRADLAGLRPDKIELIESLGEVNRTPRLGLDKARDHGAPGTDWALLTVTAGTIH